VAILTRLGETDPIVYTPASAGGDEFDNANGYSEVEIYNRAGLTRRVVFAEQRNCTFGEKGSHGRVRTRRRSQRSRLARSSAFVISTFGGTTIRRSGLR